MSDQALPSPSGVVGPASEPAQGALGLPAWAPSRREVVAWVRSGDVALVYAAIVVAVAVWLSVQPPATESRIVLDLSTNLSNLHHHPLGVLGASAFVVSSLHGLVDIPVLIVLYTVAQRWVGRIATVFVAVLGHVGATLFVATLLASGVTTGRLSRSIAHVSDVGISYGLACLAAFVILRVPRRWRVLYAIVLIAYFCGPLAWNPNFTSVGHTTALALGFGLALVVSRASSSLAARTTAAG